METQTPNSLFIKVTNEDLASASKFRKLLLKHQLIFHGSDEELFKVLEAMPKVSVSTAIETLGYFEDAKAYFFANAAYANNQIFYPNQFGMVEFNGQSYFMPYADTEIGETARKFKNAERFKYIAGEMKFNDWYKLIFEAHGNESILPVCFTISSFFRDLIFKKMHFCPILFVKGLRGSGKSSLVRNLTALFGYTQHEISLKSPNTTKSLPRLLSQLSNSVLWLDEYHNLLSDDIRGMLQSVYDGGGYEKAAFTNGVETTSVIIQSMLALTSNYVPEDEIFFSRTLLVQMNTTSKSESQRAAYKKITEIEKQGLSSVGIDILSHRQNIIENWHKAYEAVFAELSRKLADYKIDNRFIENMSATITPAYILLQNKAIEMAEMDTTDLIQYAFRNITAQYKLFYDNNTGIEFWNLIQMLYDKQIIKKDFDIKFVDGTDERTGKIISDYFIAIRFNRIYEHYRKELGNKAQHKQVILEKLMTSEYYVETKESVRFLKETETALLPGADKIEIRSSKQQTITSAMFFNTAKLKELIGIEF